MYFFYQVINVLNNKPTSYGSFIPYSVTVGYVKLVYFNGLLSETLATFGSQDTGGRQSNTSNTTQEPKKMSNADPTKHRG